MRTSPRRPLILKRRKLSLPAEDAAASQRAVTKSETDGRCDRASIEQHAIDADSDPQKFPAGIKIINHPSMPNTQVVFVPKHANVQNIIAALTAKGKECGSTGPNKFILISGGGSLRQACPPGAQEQADTETSIGGGGFGKAVNDSNMCVSRKLVDVKMGDGMLLHTAANITPNHKPKPEEENSTPALTPCPLDESLTNIQWLGKMSSDGLGSCTMRQELEDKENQPPVPQSLKQVEEDVGSLPCGSSFTSWQESIAERPPYSYMAMIQFAINSTDRKRMTLKEIYTWIEDHFPYFKHVAKPGWKNSIRHNLSLHDMFVRETSANGKISFWTIHPDANRCLTLDQVFKPMDQNPLLQVLPYDPQQKRILPELQKCAPAGSGVKSESLGTSSSTERKMKLLLPRVNSYFVPVHFPLSQQFLQQPSGKMPLSSSPSSSASTADLTKSKHVQIVPKPILQGASTSTYLPLESTKENAVVVSEEAPSAVVKDEEEDASLLSSLKENTSYTSLKPPAWRKHDVQMSTLESSQSLSYVSVKEENHLTAKRDCQFTVLRDDVPLSTWKEERTLTAAKSPARKLSDMQVIRRRKSSSRRKQHLVIPCAEEPLLVFPDCNNSDSGLVSDFSFLQETHAPDHPTDLSSAQDTCPFKTPIKEKLIKLPVSSTPSKPVGTTPQASGSEPWRVTSLNKEGSLPDFSPVRLPPGTTLTPFKDSLDLLGFSSPPFHDVPLFESPQQLLNSKSPDMTSGPFTSSPTLEPHSAKRCSKELPIGNLTNRSLTEGLVLDTMNDSLSKILLDISFTGLDEDDRFDGDNVSWSQLIPELR